MKTNERISISVVCAGALSAVGCAGADETHLAGAHGVGEARSGIGRLEAQTPSIPIPPPFAERLRSAQSWGKWEELGSIEVMPEGTKANLALARRDGEGRPKDDGQEELREALFVVDDLVNALRFRGRFDWEGLFTPEELKAPRSDTTRETGDGDAERLEASENKGWSGGSDNRTRRDVSGWGTSFNPYNRFAFVGSGCSGTIIRQTQNGTFALTAAHCLYDDNGNPIWTTVQPRRDGSTLPYGTWDVVAIHRYDAWIDDECYSGSTQDDDCRKYDIALMELSPRSGAVYPGGMTYGSYSTSTIESNTKYHRGYPGCGSGGAPSGCVARTLYGDNSHGVDNFHEGNRLFDHSSDTNGGHSGGPMYFYQNGQAKFYGVNSGNYCTGSACSDTYVNISVRITGDWFDYMYDQLHN